MLDDKIKRIIEYLAENAWCESVWLSPDPAWNVEVTSLLDEITAAYGVEKSDVAAVFNTKREEVENPKEAKKKAKEIAKKRKRTEELKKLFEKP